MKIIFSKHSKDRAAERGVSNKILTEAIKYPDKINTSNKNEKRFVAKKIYYNHILKKDHLLMIICQRESKVIKVITIIDTSKISKYY